MRFDRANANEPVPVAFADAAEDRDEPPQFATQQDSRRRNCEPFRKHNAKQCSVCDQPLSIHEQVVGETCSQASCKTQFLRVRIQTERTLQTELRNKATALRDSVAKSRKIDAPERIALGILPSNERRVTDLPQKRIRIFRDRLMGIISQAAAIRFGSDPQRPAADTRPPAESPDNKSMSVLGNACATCGGDCCRQGGDHAFIRVETIVGFMDRRPELRPRHVLQAYMSRLGHKTYDESCVYHGRAGCVLPREMRSQVCNEYLCQGLHQVLDQLPESPQDRTFVVATVGQEIVRAAVIDPDRHEMFDAAGHAIEDIPQNAARRVRSEPNRDQADHTQL